MKTQIFAFFASISLLFSCQGQTSEQVKTIPPKDFAQKIKDNPNAQILDVRTPDEFVGGHLDNAVNIDWYEKQAFESKVAKLDKSKPVFVYCAAGARSIKAANKLYSLGFKNVYDLQGGIVKWNAETSDASSSGEPEKIIGMCSQEYGEMIKSDKKVLVDFYAPWCEPCKKMAPYLTKMETERKDVKIVRLNADEHKTLVKEMKIDSLPRLLLYVDGKETWKHDGFISEEDLKKQL
ncbi:thioredoxin fold domain-containing protein [Flavobacterium sp. MAH-1]|uniref:Thioredoxin fold domain-containing protein n=1 Tax=Flavobacterium agri TaxID=2743471 RepID=A0A7Y8Y317_9FLAO|nr:thioredoxin domain-containing protein [Flavobacterium agri]NUY80999.1 thioredoxin fold domain-containing protein [Flavobacterium agri]NYA71023.1 thioredoxin fold domain-containing protein [Flavobacterium agri]